ncbi:MAG TPA: toxin-antitoxin system, antitoxin component, HicB family protein [Planctomycetes bacterium]|nr:toxin-antitoxin system, antitoxin component, HicB family protein [Planctomycetota bacterium]
MAELLKVPLILSAHAEGGFVVTSPVFPELVTEGDTIGEAIHNVRDAVLAVIEIYEDLAKPLPAHIRQDPGASRISFESLVALP